MLPSTGGSAENSQSAAPRKTADNAQTLGLRWGKASFIFSYVGTLTDSDRDLDLDGVLEVQRWPIMIPKP
jgi:hypothetical protein